MSQIIPLPNGKKLVFPDETPTEVMEHTLKQHLMGDKQGPYTPNPKEAMQSRASTGIEGYMGDINDPTNAQAAAAVEGLSLGGTKPAYGAYNAAKEALRGNDPTEGYNAGIEAYNKGMAQRDEKGGWGSTGARVAGSIPSYVAATLAGANPTMLNFLSGAAYNSDDPTSAAVGGAESAAIGKATDWGLGKLFGTGPKPAPKSYEGPGVPIPPKAIPMLSDAAAKIEAGATAKPPSFARTLTADAIRTGVKAADSELTKGAAMPALVWGAVSSGHPAAYIPALAASAARPYVTSAANRFADKIAAPAVAEAPGALKSLMNPLNRATEGPTRALLAQAMVMGGLNPTIARDAPQASKSWW